MDTSRFSDVLLDTMREVGDPEADAVVANVFARESMDAVNGMLRHLDEHNELHLDALPESVRAYLADTALPPWADRAQFAMGDDIFGRYAPSSRWRSTTPRCPYATRRARACRCWP